MHGEIKLALNKKLPPNQLAFIVLEGAIQCWGGRGHQQSYPAVNPVNYNSNREISKWMQQWHGSYGGSRPLSDWM